MNRPRKLLMKRTGPFEIEKVISRTAYRLRIPQNWKIHPVFHASLLTSYKETMEHGPNFPRPPPDLINGDEEYEVDVAHAPPTMVLFFLFLFLPLTFAFVLTAVAVLYKPGCAISAADTSSV